MSPFSYFGSMESPDTSKAMVSSEIGKGSSTSPRPSGGTCSCSGSIEAPAPTRPMIGTEFSSRYSMIGAISDALISRIPDRISETAPGRTPIAVARPPLVLPGFSSPRSINLTSSMARPFRLRAKHSNSDYPKSSLTFISEYQKLSEGVRAPATKAGTPNGNDELGARAFGRAAGPCRPWQYVVLGNRPCDQHEVQDDLYPQCHARPRQADGAGRAHPAGGAGAAAPERATRTPRRNTAARISPTEAGVRNGKARRVAMYRDRAALSVAD